MFWKHRWNYATSTIRIDVIIFVFLFTICHLPVTGVYSLFINYYVYDQNNAPNNISGNMCNVYWNQQSEVEFSLQLLYIIYFWWRHLNWERWLTHICIYLISNNCIRCQKFSETAKSCSDYNFWFILQWNLILKQVIYLKLKPHHSFSIF